MGDTGLYSQLVGVNGLEDEEYAPETEFFVIFVEAFDELASHLGSYFNSLHATSNVKF